MGEPEREMGREGEGVKHAILGPCGTDFNEPAAGCGEAGEIALAEEKGSGFRAAAGSERREDRAELGFEILLDPFAAVDEGAEDRTGPPGQHPRIGNEEEVFKPLGPLSRIQQVGFGRERQSLQILDGTERFHMQAMLLEQLAVMGREGKDDGAEVAPQLFGL